MRKLLVLNNNCDFNEHIAEIIRGFKDFPMILVLK